MQETKAGNQVKFLLDNEFFTAVHKKLTAIENASVTPTTFVRIAMWSAELSTKLPIIENQDPRTLQEALAQLDEKGHKVYIILWYGSTVSGVTGYKERIKALAFQTWAKSTTNIRVYLEPYKSVMGALTGSRIGQAVGAALGWATGYDVRTSVKVGTTVGALAGSTSFFGWGASTHQKIVLFSRAGNLRAIVGGFNLGSEYSCEANHSIQKEYWHDTALMLTGPVAATVHNEWARRWNKQGTPPKILPLATNEQPTSGNSIVTIATTNSESSIRENDIRTLMINQIRTATRSIYIENYAFTDPALVYALADRLKKGRINVVVMINHPKSELFEANTTWSYFQTDVFKALANANGGQSVMYAACTNHTRTSRTKIKYKCWPYPHSKLAIFDDRTLVVGSANWTYRSMEYDGEITAFVTDGQLVPAIRQRLLSHWWKTPNGNGPVHMDVAKWIQDANVNNHNPPVAGCKILRLRAEDFEDWQTLSYQKRAALSAAWTMF